MIRELTFNEITIRTKQINGELHWCVSDVGVALGMKDVHRQARKLETKGGTTSPTLTAGGKQNVMFINEPALYELVFKSKLEQAKKFRLWVFEEVLPNIRKTGKYEISKSLKDKSTRERNYLTKKWSESGVSKKHEFINLTRKEYSSLNFPKGIKKKDMTKKEILTLHALEAMEALKLELEPKDGYYECRDSLEETAESVLKVTEKKKKEIN